MKEEKVTKYFTSVKVGEKGQIVIPKQVRDIFGIKAGDNLLLLANIENGIGILTADKFDEINAIITSRGGTFNGKKQ